jgi:hypothetical protein
MSYGQPELKRQRADQDEIIAAGLNYSTEETYLSTNIVNLSYFDGTPQHGLPANFTQSRTTQIVGNTKRSQVGVASAEIQTKSLPIFQPQVKVGSDRDALIYEVGTSATWSGCLINPNPEASEMSTLAFPSSLDLDTNERDNFTSGQATVQYNNASIGFQDSYGFGGVITAFQMNTDVVDTLLRGVFSYWQGPNSELHTMTSLKPVVIPSVFTPIFRFAPLYDRVTSMSLNKSYVVVESVKGFSVGDKVLLFGVTKNTSGADMKAYYTISSISKYSDMANSNAVKLDPFVTPNIYDMYVICFDVDAFLYDYPPVYGSGGYLINTRVDSLGGRIEFLTDENEFQNRTGTVYNTYSPADGNYISILISGTPNEGFLRTGWSGVVELYQAGGGQYNSYYHFESSVPSGGGILARLRPLYTVFPTAVVSTMLTVRLAPNYYNFDTRVLSYPSSDTDTSSIQFMKSFGYQPTGTLDTPKAQNPPRCTPSVKSWRRAFTPDFFFSVYRGLQWTTQDVDVLPSLPTIQQDFGSDSGSSYYNVYDFRSFIDESINPAFNKLLIEPPPAPEIPLMKVTNVSSTLEQTTFTLAVTVDYGPNNFPIGALISASGFPLVQFIDPPNRPLPFFVPIDGLYTVQSRTMTTLVCNNPNSLLAFAIQPYTGVVANPDPLYMSDFSLNVQLAFQSVAYQRAFTTANSALEYAITTPYQLGDPVVYLGNIYIANTASLGKVPGIEQGDRWYYLGKAKKYTVTTDGSLYFSNDVEPVFQSAFNTYSQQVRVTPIPQFQTQAVEFSLDPVSNLISYQADSVAYGDTSGFPLENRITKLTGHGFIKNDSNYNYSSWGSQNGTGNGQGDEYMSIETNSSFKFLIDNFTARSIRYVNPDTNGLLIYWIWGSYTLDPVGFVRRKFQQSVESLSSCLSPVQSIVILSKTIPVVQTLLSPASVLSDVNSSVSNVGGVTGDSDSIVGEFYITPGMLSSCKSVIRYQPDEVMFYSLQSTKTFKQVDYNVCYRHRVTQKLVPLSLTNYGNINIKFVFKPT